MPPGHSGSLYLFKVEESPGRPRAAWLPGKALLHTLDTRPSRGRYAPVYTTYMRPIIPMRASGSICTWGSPKPNPQPPRHRRAKRPRTVQKRSNATDHRCPDDPSDPRKPTRRPADNAGPRKRQGGQTLDEGLRGTSGSRDASSRGPDGPVLRPVPRRPSSSGCPRATPAQPRHSETRSARSRFFPNLEHDE